ncbi:MAG: glycosyltransferase family 4 protein [Winogradskyella sp.]|uniref:glycosyltransferase family 4 protein n=1 Tax=Winogradskyella sp. TaxID=1883156 RepID=UPI00385884CC
MKILWVTRSFLDYRIPVFKALKNLNYGEFTLIFNEDYVPDSVVKKVKSELGDSCIGLKGEFTLGNKNTTNKWANKGLRIPFQPKLIKTIKAQKPDVIISDGFFQWTYAALWMRFFYKTKHVMCYERTMHTERSAQWYRTAYRKLVSKWIDSICCTGALCGEYVKSLGFNMNKVSYGHMVADVEKFYDKIEPKPDILKQNGTEQTLKYLYVGRIVEAKGINELLIAWKNFQNEKKVSLFLVGDGPDKQKYEVMSKDLGLYNVHFLGKVNYDFLPKYYQSADVFVIPTLEDNWSLVVPEAMASSLPILCSNYNGCWPELVTASNGWVFDALKPHDFLDKLELSFFENNLKEMGLISKNLITKYDKDYAVNGILEAVNIASK